MKKILITVAIVVVAALAVIYFKGDEATETGVVDVTEETAAVEAAVESYEVDAVVE